MGGTRMAKALVDLENNGSFISLNEAFATIWNCKDTEKLDRYARHGDSRVLRMVAKYTKDASLDSYLLLANSKDKEILGYLTSNTNVPSEVHLHIWREYILNPSDRWNALENIFAGELIPSDEIVKSLHDYMSMYEDEKDDDKFLKVEMLSMLCLNKHISTHDLNRLLSYNEDDIIDSVVWNRNLDFATVISIANAGNINAQKAAFDRRHELIQYLQKTGGNDFDYNSLNKDWVRNLLGWK
jgi:hypothetical protein